MKLAVQIILYHSSSHLAALLESLKLQTYGDVQYFFYDNSEDAGEAKRSEELVKASGIPARFMVGDKNIGFAGGHAAMFGMHEAPFVMLLNDDAKLAPDYLEVVLRRIEQDPSIASVTGLVFRWMDGERIVDTAGLEYLCLGQIRDRFAGRRMSDDDVRAEEPRNVYGASGAIGLYRRSAIKAAGGLFDPKWFMYKEDVDLAIRLRRAGFKAWYDPRAVAWHKRGLKEEGKGFFARLNAERKRPPLLRRYSYVNQWRIYKRHFAWSLGWRDIVRTIMIEIRRSALVFLASPKVFFQAWYDIIRA